MPFAVFRRHQRKLLAIFAILAMFSFVVADSLPKLLSGNSPGGGNPVVVDLYGKSVRRNDVQAMLAQRGNANQFMAELTGQLTGRPSQYYFGDLKTKSLVDALILQHEADRLSMPAGPQVARDWLKQRAGAAMTRERFEQVLSRFNNGIGGEQLLSDIGNQVRLLNVRLLVGNPVLTPLDVFQTYRDQTERVSARAVSFPVENYRGGIADPDEKSLQEFFRKYKDALPDPNRPTPGFKVPRLVEVEILSIDGTALAASIKGKLTEAELLAYYENRKGEFKKPSEFPDEIFAGDAGGKEFTPPIVQTLAEVRPILATSLAEEKAQTEMLNTFGRIKDEVMIPFADRYLEAVDEQAEAKKGGLKSQATLPKPNDLQSVAKKEGLQYQATPLLTREKADLLDPIHEAEVGLSRFSGGRKFAEELFDTKSILHEPIEFTDPEGRRYLVRKLQDVPPRVPRLEEVRAEVVLAWKTEQARPRAAAAAREYAQKRKAAGGTIKGEVDDGHPVITTDPITKLQPGIPLPGRFLENAPAAPTEIRQLSRAGPVLRETYFGLKQGDVEVAPNRPETVYYVLALNVRVPARFEVLYAPNGDLFLYQSETMREASRKRDESWMNELRASAGLKPDWTPSDEAKNATEVADND